jgi:hypothetical protein
MRKDAYQRIGSINLTSILTTCYLDAPLLPLPRPLPPRSSNSNSSASSLSLNRWRSLSLSCTGLTNLMSCPPSPSFILTTFSLPSTQPAVFLITPQSFSCRSSIPLTFDGFSCASTLNWYFKQSFTVTRPVRRPRCSMRMTRGPIFLKSSMTVSRGRRGWTDRGVGSTNLERSTRS